MFFQPDTVQMDGYAVYNSEFSRFNTVLDKEIRQIDTSKQVRILNAPFKYGAASFEPTYSDVITEKSSKSHFFDIHYIEPTQKFKELKDEMEKNICKLMDKHGIVHLALTMEDDKKISLMVEEVELVKAGKIRFIPMAKFNYDSVKTNTGILVATSLKVNIGFEPERIYPSWTEWAMSFF